MTGWMRTTFTSCLTIYVTHFALALPAPSFEVGVTSDRVHINGQYNNFGDDWQRLVGQKQDFDQFLPDRFTLLVHAGSNPSKVDKLLKNNNLLAESFAFSASLIDQDHRFTYGNYGVILSVPPLNVLGTSSKDMGTQFATAYSAESLEDIKAEEFYYSYLLGKNPVLTPETILENTKNTYNEILVAGTTLNAGSVKIIGLFLKTTNGVPDASPEVVEKVQELAKRLQVKILFIANEPNKQLACYQMF